MMNPSAKVIADSTSATGHRLTTLEVRMHRFILAEFNTHRLFSRSSASSRAIPVQKQIDRVTDNPALPISYGKNIAGMQATEVLDEDEAQAANRIILKMRDACIDGVEELVALGVHKQVANRYIEPWMWHTVIVSATEWENFFIQRCSSLAQPEIEAVANEMYEAIEDSKPEFVDYEQWHLPYIQFDEDHLPLSIKKRVSVARCARVSYLNHDGTRNIDKDLALYDRLITADPPHWAPLEMVATPGRLGEVPKGNFSGWHQLRHLTEAQ